VALGLTLHSSSSVLICVVVICLALSCSFSVGVFTSQAKKDLGSEMRREEKRRVGCYNSCSGGLQVEKVEEIDKEEE
jgi:hypothetical protein